MSKKAEQLIMTVNGEKIIEELQAEADTEYGFIVTTLSGLVLSGQIEGKQIKLNVEPPEAQGDIKLTLAEAAALIQKINGLLFKF